MSKGGRIIGKIVSTLLKIILMVTFIFPFVWMALISLQTEKETTSMPITIFPKVPQWHNYIDALHQGPFDVYFRNSIIIIVAVVVIQTLIMIPAAYVFAKYNFKGKKILFALVLIAFMTPQQLTFLPIYYNMAKLKLLNTLVPQIIPFMTNAFGIFLLRQYFMQVPDELIEAAKLDNASEFKILWKIMMPLAKPAMATILLFSFINTWNSYFWPLVMTHTEAVRPLTIGVAALKDTEGILNWNIIMAGNMILVLPILLVYIFASKYIIKAFAYSGIK